jgi:hypothetical protein
LDLSWRLFLGKLPSFQEVPGSYPAPTRRIEGRLGGYSWPGNIRELAQCVSNILIRREYSPRGAARATGDDPRRAVAEEILAGRLSADEVLNRYCTLVFAGTGSYQEAARRLGLDSRTVTRRGWSRGCWRGCAPAPDLRKGEGQPARLPYHTRRNASYPIGGRSPR